MNYEHYQKLKEYSLAENAQAWNEYKIEQENIGRRIDLRFANLDYCFLRGFSLSNANLQYASFKGTDLLGANISKADLRFSLFTIIILWISLCILPICGSLLIAEYSSGLVAIGLMILYSTSIYILIYRQIIGLTDNIIVLSIGFSSMSAFMIHKLFLITLTTIAIAGPLIIAFLIAFITNITHSAIGSDTKSTFSNLTYRFAFGESSVFTSFGVILVVSLFLYNGFNINSGIFVGTLTATLLNSIVYYRLLHFNKIALQWALDPSQAIGYIPPKQTNKVFKEQERLLHQKEKELFDLNNQQELNSIQKDLEEIKDSITSQKSLYAKIDNILSLFEKPNTYISNLIRFNWGMLVFFVAITTLALSAVGYLEYDIYQKYWAKPTNSAITTSTVVKADSTIKKDSTILKTDSSASTPSESPSEDVPFWAYSPILFAGVILGFSVTQINRRLKEIHNLNEKRRFVEGIKSTLQAYNLTHNVEETEAQIRKTVEKLESYYFQLQKEEDKENEESNSNALVEQLVNFIKSNGSS